MKRGKGRGSWECKIFMVGVTLAYSKKNERKSEILGIHKARAEWGKSICCDRKCPDFVFILREMENLWVLSGWHGFVKNPLVVAGKLPEDNKSGCSVASYKTIAVVQVWTGGLGDGDVSGGKEKCTDLRNTEIIKSSRLSDGLKWRVRERGMAVFQGCV